MTGSDKQRKPKAKRKQSSPSKKRSADKKAKRSLGGASTMGEAKRNKRGQWTRVLNPVAKRVIVKEPEPYYAPPGRYGMDWNEIGEGLEHDAPMPDEYMPMLTSKALPRLIDHIMPTLDPQRKRALRERIHARVQQRRNAAATEQRKVRGYADQDEREHRARRLTRNEKSALKRLKELLRKR